MYDKTVTFRHADTGEVKNMTVAQAREWGVPDDVILKKLKDAAALDEQLTGVKKEDNPVSGADAGKLSMAETGIAAVKDAKKTLFQEDESGKTKSSIQSKIALLGATTDLTPGSKIDLTPWGRGLQQDLFDSVEALLRVRSGAAVPEQEVQRYLNEKGPKLTDPVSVQKSKLQSIEDELTGLVTAMGRTPRPRNVTTEVSSISDEDEKLINKYKNAK